MILSGCFLIITLIFPMILQGQISSGIQLNLSGGSSFPLGDFRNKEVFAGNGYHFAGGLDYYFFKVLGIGLEGGYFENDSKSPFKDFIYQNYLINFEPSKKSSWQTKYIFGGPTIKTSFNRFEIDFTAKFGVYQAFEPKLLYVRTNYGESYDMFRSVRNEWKWLFGWNAGIRTIYKLSDWFGIQAKAEYWSTKGFDKLEYNFAYRNVADLDRNGHFDDTEFNQANLVTKRNNTNLNVVNVNLGMVLQFGNIKQIDKMELKAEEIDRILNEVNQGQQTNHVNQRDRDSLNNQIQLNASNQRMEEMHIVPSVDPIKDSLENTALSNIDDHKENLIVDEAQVRKMWADSLNDAGELHFSVQMYREAAKDFGLILNEPDYPRSRYMYAMSLSLSGQCDEAKKEFKEFKKSYNGEDSRSLEVLFVSQFQNCAGIAKGLAAKAQNTPNEDKNLATQPATIPAKEYQVQFIAIKKEDVKFLSVSKMGDIRTEYTGTKKLYRYLLTGYQNIEDAKEDLKLVRSKGFQDAFIARYEHGKRVETMYHEGKRLD